MLRLAAVLVLATVLSGCLGQRPYPAVPAGASTEAEVVGFPDVRFWGDEPPDGVAEELAVINQQVAERARKTGSLPNRGRVDMLVLSGGGSDGAYGAGMMNGWTARGDRPEFALVTGISTGALIAPFAFVGDDFDDELERFYTNTKTADVIVPALYDVLVGDSLGLADTQGFVDAVDRALTPEFIKRIAEEHNKGRRLWVGTTNIDAQRPVIWNIGAIAATGRPGARVLIRDVLIASASIPGAFSPQLIQVEVNGRRYTEMHVDGGVTRQLFLYPIDLKLSEYIRSRDRRMRPGTIYVVRNTLLDPKFQAVAPRVLEITARSVSTLIKFSGVADVEIIRAQAISDGFGLQFTSVPADFSVEEAEFFDPVYMRALYEVGYDRIVEGEAWTVAVPSRR
ncbi:MAG: patatin-like phospholipase family protein [Pseudomonadota bacterium]